MGIESSWLDPVPYRDIAGSDNAVQAALGECSVPFIMAPADECLKLVLSCESQWRRFQGLVQGWSITITYWMVSLGHWSRCMGH